MSFPCSICPCSRGSRSRSGLRAASRSGYGAFAGARLNGEKSTVAGVDSASLDIAAVPVAVWSHVHYFIVSGL